MTRSTENGSARASDEARRLGLDTDDSTLRHAFEWASHQALAYAFEGDPVGPWYEAALPGREAFCMRDVSHHAMGAHALGLAPHTKNMLRAFASSVTRERDWCGLWEIDRNGRAPSVDYADDDAFWYCLPANFDLIDCCYRMYRWTGDRDYVDDPVFTDFYRRSVTEYVDRWDLGLDAVMRRPRLMNGRAVRRLVSRLANNRGLPGYNESDGTYSVSLGLLSSMQAGYRAYARLLQLESKGSEAHRYFELAEAVTGLIESTWWDPAEGTYYNIADPGGRMKHSDRTAHELFYWRPQVGAERAARAMRATLASLPQGPTDAVEMHSHLPEILYRAEEVEAAHTQLLLLTEGPRKEYPEASFCAIGALVEGMMGVSIEDPSRGQTPTDGTFVDHVITTRSRLSDNTGYANLSDLPIHANRITVRHKGTTTTLTNARGPSFIWRALIPGTYDSLRVDGDARKAVQTEESAGQRSYSGVFVVVGAGETKTVTAP